MPIRKRTNLYQKLLKIYHLSIKKKGFLRGSNFWYVNIPQGCSWGWRKILDSGNQKISSVGAKLNIYKSLNSKNNIYIHTHKRKHKIYL